VKGKSRRITRPVVRIDFLGDTLKLKEYDSAYQAAERTGIAQSSINMVCRGKRYVAGGYGWRYM